MKHIFLLSIIIISGTIFLNSYSSALALIVDDPHPSIGGSTHVLDANADHYYSIFKMDSGGNGSDACAFIYGTDLVDDNNLVDYGTCFVNDNGNFQVVELSDNIQENYNDSIHEVSFVDKREIGIQNQYLFDFSLSNGGNVAIDPGNSVDNSVTATLNSGTPKPVYFIPLGLPDFTSVYFLPETCTPTCSSTLNISTDPLTPPGDYSILLVGESQGAITQTSSFIFTVKQSQILPINIVSWREVLGF